MNWSLSLRKVQARPWLAELDPRVKLAWLATISVGCLWFSKPAALVALTVAAAFPYVAIRLPWRALVAYSALLLLMLWSTVLSQAFFIYDPQGEPLFTIVPAF